MGRRSKKQGLNVYQTADVVADNGRDGGARVPFGQRSVTLLEHPAFLAMTAEARCLHEIFLIEGSAGPASFTFTKKNAEKKGFDEKTLRRCIVQLVDFGFVDIVERNGNCRKANKYSLSLRWHGFTSKDVAAKKAEIAAREGTKKANRRKAKKAL